jgi:hypothetical protein
MHLASDGIWLIIYPTPKGGTLDKSTLSAGLAPDLREKIRTHYAALGLTVVSQTDEADEYQDENGRKLYLNSRLEAETEPELLAITWVTKLISQLNKL